MYTSIVYYILQQLVPGPTHSHGTPIPWLGILKGTPCMQPIGKHRMLFLRLALQQERDTKGTAQCKAQDTNTTAKCKAWDTGTEALLLTPVHRLATLQHLLLSFCRNAAASPLQSSA